MSYQQPSPQHGPFPQSGPFPPPRGGPPGRPHLQERSPQGGPAQAAWEDSAAGQSGHPPVPPRSGNRRAVVVAVAVIAAAVSAVGAFVLLNDDGSGGDGPNEAGAAYKLTTPGMVIQGDYVRDRKRSGPRDDGFVARGTAFSATYDGYNGMLVFRGAHGTITNPGTAVDSLLSEAGLDDGITADRPPAGYEVDVWKCGATAVGASERPFCAWGDRTTVGLVTWGPPRPSKGGTDPDYVSAPSPARWLDTVRSFRDEVRVER